LSKHRKKRREGSLLERNKWQKWGRGERAHFLKGIAGASTEEERGLTS
jgi:hypothetical protein